MDKNLAHIMIKKTTAALLLCTTLYGCNPKQNDHNPTPPFQCVNSQTRCEVVTEFGTVSVKFNVEKVLTELPFSIQVTLIKDAKATEGFKSKNNLKVVGYMEGETMFMGKIPLFFDANAEGKHDGIHTAETMLGSCSEDIMTWRLWITLEEQGNTELNQQMTFFIDFDSTRV